MDYVFSGTVINITSIRSPRDSPGSVGLVVEQAASPDMPTKQVSSLEHLGVWDNVVSPAFQFGAVAGISGTIVGGVWALYRSRHPRLLTALYGFQSFAIGSTYWATRSTILHIRPFADNFSLSEPPSPSDRLTASTISGGLAGGSIIAITAGRRSFIPGTLVYALMGFVGQRAIIWADERHARSVEREKDEETAGREEVERGWIDRVASMKWTGLTKLTNDEYAGILGEKMLKIEAQIAIIDEQIEELRLEKEKQQVAGRQPEPTREGRQNVS